MLVREYIDFERGQDPKRAMGLGVKEMIRKWFDSFPNTILEGPNYTINPNMTIDVNMPMDLIGEKHLFPNGELPSYINFLNTGELDVDDCGLTSLRGFPQEVFGYFSCQLNELTSLEEGPKKVGGGYYCNGNAVEFTEDYVRSICDVEEGIQADDTPEP